MLIGKSRKRGVQDQSFTTQSISIDHIDSATNSFILKSMSFENSGRIIQSIYICTRVKVLNFSSYSHGQFLISRGISEYIYIEFLQKPCHIYQYSIN
jgi:hypothetical protein